MPSTTGSSYGRGDFFHHLDSPRTKKKLRERDPRKLPKSGRELGREERVQEGGAFG